MTVLSQNRTSALGRSTTVNTRPEGEVHGRPLSEGGLTPIRIRTRDQWSSRRNSLKRHRLWRIVHEEKWSLIRTEIGRFGYYMDQSKHC